MKKLKYALLISLKILIIISIFSCFWWITTVAFRYQVEKDKDQFKLLPKNSIDVIALGSSHMQYAFNPSSFYTYSGLYSYVLGSSCQPFSMSKYVFLEALKTQKPEVVLIDVFTLLPQSQVCYADGMFYKAMNLMEGKNRFEAGEVIDNQSLKREYQFDLLMNHDLWRTMTHSDTEKMKEMFQKNIWYNSYFGYVPAFPTEFGKLPLVVHDITQNLSISTFYTHIIKDMIDIAKKNNIYLLFVKTPYVIDQDSTNVLDAVWKVIDQYGGNYIDFTKITNDIGWHYQEDGDAWHNNSWGAEIITKYLAEYIQENAKVKRHKENEIINQLLYEMKKYTAYYLMSWQNQDIYKLLDFAQKYPSIQIIRYRGKNRTSIKDYENQLLNNVGFKHDFIKQKNQDYYALVCENELIQESSEPFSLEFKGHMIDITDSGVFLDGKQQSRSDTEMSIVFAGTDFSFVNSLEINYASSAFWKID